MQISNLTEKLILTLLTGFPQKTQKQSMQRQPPRLLPAEIGLSEAEGA
jgi:hypothetical protein